MLPGTVAATARPAICSGAGPSTTRTLQPAWMWRVVFDSVPIVVVVAVLIWLPPG